MKSKESFHNIITSAIVNSRSRIAILDYMEMLLKDYKEEEIKLTPNSRCNVLIEILDKTNPELNQDEKDYITNAILHDKGILKSIESLNHYANVKLTTNASNDEVSVVVDSITVSDSTNLLSKLEELINELIFTLNLKLRITLILHKVSTVIEVVDVVSNIHQTRIINIGR